MPQFPSFVIFVSQSKNVWDLQHFFARGQQHFRYLVNILRNFRKTVGTWRNMVSSQKKTVSWTGTQWTWLSDQKYSFTLIWTQSLKLNINIHDYFVILNVVPNQKSIFQFRALFFVVTFLCKPFTWFLFCFFGLTWDDHALLGFVLWVLILSFGCNFLQIVVLLKFFLCEQFCLCAYFFLCCDKQSLNLLFFFFEVLDIWRNLFGFVLVRCLCCFVSSFCFVLFVFVFLRKFFGGLSFTWPKG